VRIRRLLLLIFVAVLCTAGLFLVVYDARRLRGAGEAGNTGIRINEVMTSNKGTVSDGNGNFPDWLELYNSSDKDVNISGYGLSDDKLAAAKWAFPSGTVVPAKGYLVVYCSGDAEKGAMHAAFKLSAHDALILSNTSGHVEDSSNCAASPPTRCSRMTTRPARGRSFPSLPRVPQYRGRRRAIPGIPQS
jgi:hypothetical protein